MKLIPRRRFMAPTAKGVARASAGCREVKFDPKTETLIGDAEAARFLKHDYRPPFGIPEDV